MNWSKRLELGCAGLILFAFATVFGLWMWQPWVPQLVFSDPGPTGRRVIIAGNPANYFPSKKPGRQPAILVLGGSEGGLGMGAARNARELQAAGYSALQLSYFRAASQPANLERIPLETFDAALAWMKAQPDVDPDRIGIVGVSKGAEAALLMASRRSDVDVVVAGAPSSVVWPGFNWNGVPVSGSSWTSKGRDVPALRLGDGQVFIDVGSVYRAGLAVAAAKPAAAIPIERSRARVLLVCGEADSLWPACVMARQLKVRAPHKVAILSYSTAGHGAFGAPANDGHRRGSAVFGGTIEGNRKAKEISWRKTIHFLNSAFNEANRAAKAQAPGPFPARGISAW